MASARSPGCHLHTGKVNSLGAWPGSQAVHRQALPTKPRPIGAPGHRRQGAWALSWCHVSCRDVAFTSAPWTSRPGDAQGSPRARPSAPQVPHSAWPIPASLLPPSSALGFLGLFHSHVPRTLQPQVCDRPVPCPSPAPTHTPPLQPSAHGGSLLMWGRVAACLGWMTGWTGSPQGAPISSLLLSLALWGSGRAALFGAGDHWPGCRVLCEAHTCL